MNLFDSIQSVQTLAQQIWFVTFPLAPRCQTSDNTRFWDPKATKTQKDKVFLTAHHSKKALQVCSFLVFCFSIVVYVFLIYCHGGVLFLMCFAAWFLLFSNAAHRPETGGRTYKKHGLTCLEVLFVFVNCCFLAVSSPLLVCVYRVVLPGSFFHMVHFLSFLSVFFHCVSLKKPLPI